MRWIIITVPVLVLFDQITKYFFDGKATNFSSFINITTVHNTGGIWGIGHGLNMLFALLSVAALLILLRYVKTYPVQCSFLFSGIIGNLIDRGVLGYVRDFIQIGAWPAFNFADSFITIGVIFFIVRFFYEDKVYKNKSRRKG